MVVITRRNTDVRLVTDLTPVIRRNWWSFWASVPITQVLVTEITSLRLPPPPSSFTLSLSLSTFHGGSVWHARNVRVMRHDSIQNGLSASSAIWCHVSEVSSGNIGETALSEKKKNTSSFNGVCLFARHASVTSLATLCAYILVFKEPVVHITFIALSRAPKIPRTSATTHSVNFLEWSIPQNEWK